MDKSKSPQNSFRVATQSGSRKIAELNLDMVHCMSAANEQKLSRYQELVEQCRRQGWQAHCKL